MNRSLRSCFVFTVAMICFAAFGYAQVSPGGIVIKRAPVFSVKLLITALPSGLAFVTTVYAKDPNSMALAPPDLFTDSRLRYTYTSQRTWPCAGPTRPSSSGATTTPQEVGILVPGKYKVTVHVTSVNPLIARPGYVPLVPLPAVIGDASLENLKGPMQYTVRAPFSYDQVQFSFNPPSGTHAAPVPLISTWRVVPETSGMRYIFHVECGRAACQPETGTLDSAQPAYVFFTTIASSATRNFFYTSVDEVRQSDCAWLGTTAYVTPEYMVVH